jgi:hypothetical protein
MPTSAWADEFANRFAGGLSFGNEADMQEAWKQVRMRMGFTPLAHGTGPGVQPYILPVLSPLQGQCLVLAL